MHVKRLKIIFRLTDVDVCRNSRVRAVMLADLNTFAFGAIGPMNFAGKMFLDYVVPVVFEAEENLFSLA